MISSACWRLAWVLAAVAAVPARAVVTAVSPVPGSLLHPGDAIILGVSPPMSQAEFDELDRLIEIRDERSGRLYWNAAGGVGPPYGTVTIIPNETQIPWSAGGTVRLEMMADSSLAPVVSLQPGHFRWPLVCEDCEWIGEAEAWSLSLQGPASETQDLLPLDLDRDALNDLSLARRDMLVFFGVDTCASNPLIHALGGLPPPGWALDRRLSTLTLGASGGSLHPGEGLLLHTGGQDESVTVLARSGPDDSPVFTQLTLEDGSYDGSPKLARPLRMEPGHLCQDLLVATRGGDLVLFPARDDCAQVDPNAARVLLSGLGDPLDLLIVPGTSLAPGGFHDLIFLLEASPTPLRCLVWDGEDLEPAWTMTAEALLGVEALEAWSNGDPAGRPDLVAWSGDGHLAVIEDVDAEAQEAEFSFWSLSEPLRDVEALPDGRLVLAGWSSIQVSPDPATGALVPFQEDLRGPVRRLSTFDANGDGDHDLLVLYEDGQVDVHLDEPVGAWRLEMPERLSWSGVAVGDTVRHRLALRHRGLAGTMVLDLSGPPADPGFPFTWPDLAPLSLEPGDSVEVEILVHPAAAVDSCWRNYQFNAWWSFPGCVGQVGQSAVVLCLQAGSPAAALAADSLVVGEDCGGRAGCEEDCPAADLWLRNTGDAALVLGTPWFTPHPDDSLSAPQSFCAPEWTAAAVAAGDSGRVRVSFCPPMNDPWPWRQGAVLHVPTNAPGADSLLSLPVLGLLTCPWPPLFTDDLPPMTEDLAAWLDLEPLVTDPDNTIGELTMVVRGVAGTGGLPADSVLVVEAAEGLRVRVRPGPDVNSERFPGLGLDLELRDPSGNVTRDTLLCRLLPVDDPPAWLGLPDTALTVREGRALRLPFRWREVDGEALASAFTLSRDAAGLIPVDSAQVVGDGAWTYLRDIVPGDSALFAGRLWWRCRLADTAGGQGYAIAAAGRLDLTSRRDTLRMSEDQELVLNLADWLLSPGEDPDAVSASLLGVTGTGGLPPEEALAVEDLGGLLFRLTPAPDLSADQVPGLGLIFQLSEDGSPTRVDSLQVDLAPRDDAPRLRLRPAAGAALREGVESLLAWELEEVDGEVFAGRLLVGHSAAFADTVAYAELGPARLRVDLAHRPAVGDSLRWGGRLHWRVEAADAPPGAGTLLAADALDILQSPQDLQLNLGAGLPQRARQGDTLAVAARIFSATGYVGGLVLRLEQDLQEAARVDWPWVDLGAGAALDTTLALAMPLGRSESCWSLALIPGNPAEDEADNELAGCVTLGREPLGPEWTAFTPNGDGVHDRLRFQFGLRPAARGFRVEIFDAGGRRVVAHDLPAGDRDWWWDGRSQGRELLPGAYLWVLLDGERVLARGQVGVVR